MIPCRVLLSIAFVGIVFFAVSGHKADIGKINVWFNGVSLFATLWLAINVFNNGTILSADKSFLIDSFNVYLIVLTAFIGLTTSIFLIPTWNMKKS